MPKLTVCDARSVSTVISEILRNSSFIPNQNSLNKLKITTSKSATHASAFKVKPSAETGSSDACRGATGRADERPVLSS